MTSVAGLVLAAGSGSRLGGPKALVEIDGDLLVHRAVRLLFEGGCDPVVVVVGACADEVEAQLSGVLVVRCENWSEGMGASLRKGLASLDAPACVVALVDQPLVSSEAVRRLLHAHEAGAVVAVATYDGRPRNPVLLGASVWAEVSALAIGDVGARPWLRTHPDAVTPVPCDGTGSPFDIDTPADLQQLTEHRQAPETRSVRA